MNWLESFIYPSHNTISVVTVLSEENRISMSIMCHLIEKNTYKSFKKNIITVNKETHTAHIDSPKRHSENV